MPVFMVERQYTDALDLGTADLADVNRVNDEEDVRWLYSFLSADHRKTFCLYEADSVESIRRAAARAGLPADAIVEVVGRVQPDGEIQPV